QLCSAMCVHLLVCNRRVYCIVGCMFFFFSSRRRHTRSKRDWSSDVCSSDLSFIDKIKLGLLASIEISPKSSGGDLAAGALGGWVYYQAPDRDTLARVLTGNTSVSEALHGPAWLPMRARRIPTPTDVQVLIGWTGSPAQTDQLVTQAANTGNCLNWIDTFLRPSAANVNRLILAL